ncbi:4Fe-4S dicluster domain-containing protein [Desulfofundulus thermocisternus]|uniref:4Fe-4S dicluster domain-containing protein n=1 Tax=Desulfofundulus thermocisternus TaxID=42471 RepID=UPI00217D1320|nr:4Fe-4S dicluster domain-containing protein [Desulfofundulus thermocisternus]MCS5695859.1 4Fe-4S dicluster domain-containing protein [Desulfofundulus thermocisternus]
MNAYIITRDNLRTWIDALIRDYTLVAPVREEEKVSLFKPVGSFTEIDLNYTNSTISPKGWLFPQTEEMFFFFTSDNQINLEDACKPGTTILFGLRPCDVKGIIALDPVFNGTYQDCYYQMRRQNTILVCLCCTRVERHCFCNSMGGGPTNGEEADLLLTEMEDGYGIEVLTSRGEELVNKYHQLFAVDGDNRVSKTRDEMGKKLASQFSRKVDISGIKEFLDQHFELPYWNELAQRCLGCGICTFICPTCHCFDIFDQSPDGESGVRSRCWDSCMFSHFTRMAGGHNPRPTKKERIRNRFLHKLKYHRDRYNLDGCVGCGRCINKCPVNIDIRQIIADLQEVARYDQLPLS